MKADTIVDARCTVLRAEVGDGIAMSFAPLRARTMVLVEVETADGRIGLGESWVNYPSWAHQERVATLREGVFPMLIGADAGEVEATQRRLRARLGPVGRQWGAPGPIMQAISAVDVALWDLRAQAAGASVAQALGGPVRDRIPAYASSLGPDGVAPALERLRGAGFDAVKVKVGFGRDRDEANVATVREACPDIEIYVDANQAWTLAEAVAFVPMLERHGVLMIEEPIRGDRLSDLERLHASTGMRIATGENLYGREAFAAYAASPAIAVLQPDVAKAGGLTECLAVCELAHQHGTAVMPHLYGGAVAYLATLQLAARAPAVVALEYDIRENPLRDPLLLDPPQPRSGALDLPDGPGLGIRLDRAAMARHTINPAPEEAVRS